MDSGQVMSADRFQFSAFLYLGVKENVLTSPKQLIKLLPLAYFIVQCTYNHA